MKGQQGFLPTYCEGKGFLLVLHPLDGIPHLKQSKDMREGHSSSSTAGGAPASHGEKAATAPEAQWGCAALQLPEPASPRCQHTEGLNPAGAALTSLL